MIEYKTGNLLDSDADILINTVNCVGVMGKGIALEFKNRFPEMFEEYKRQCRFGVIELGNTYSYHLKDGRIVINFPTKKHWKNPSQYEWIKSGLISLKYSLEQYREPLTVAIPPLGCGNGGLDWKIVHPMIIDTLGNLNHKLYIYVPRSNKTLTGVNNE